MRLYASIALDEHDHFTAEGPDPDAEPGTAYGVVRLREFSIQGDPVVLRRFAATVLDAADLAEQATRT
jgi:hypothetical protein